MAEECERLKSVCFQLYEEQFKLSVCMYGFDGFK